MQLRKIKTAFRSSIAITIIYSFLFMTISINGQFAYAEEKAPEIQKNKQETSEAVKQETVKKTDKKEEIKSTKTEKTKKTKKLKQKKKEVASPQKEKSMIENFFGKKEKRDKDRFQLDYAPTEQQITDVPEIDKPTPFYKHWLFWTAIGLAAIGGAVVGIKYGTDDSDSMTFNVKRRNQ